jgi:hypothetical protein
MLAVTVRYCRLKLPFATGGRGCNGTKHQAVKNTLKERATAERTLMTAA